MKIPAEWIISTEKIQNQDRITIRFYKLQVWIDQVKQFSGVRWEPSIKAWHIADCAEHRKIFGMPPKDVVGNSINNHAQTDETRKQQLQKFSVWMRSHRYSEIGRAHV